MRRDSCGFDAVVGWERGTVGPLCKTLSGCEILSDSMLGGTAAARRMAGHSEPRVGLWQRVAVQIEKLRFGVETCHKSTNRVLWNGATRDAGRRGRGTAPANRYSKEGGSEVEQESHQAGQSG